MSFFRAFPKTPYSFPNRSETEIVDIFRTAITIDRGIDAAAAYQVYTIEDQRPDQLSNELYGNANYYWTFFVVNKELRRGWPLSAASFEEYMDSKYNGFAMTLYRTDVNFALISGAELPGDEPEYNSIAGKFEVGTIIRGIGRDEIITGSGTIPAIPPSNVEAEVIGRSPDTNTIYFRYLLPDTEFTPEEEFFARAPDSSTYNIFDKYVVRQWRDAPAYYINDSGDRVTNPTNILLPVTSYVTLYDDELAENDKRKRIRIIRDDYIEDFIVAYRKSINGK